MFSIVKDITLFALKEGGHILLELKGNGHYEMQIKTVSPSDVGSYICRAHNAVGQHKGTGSISVRCKLTFSILIY